MKKQSSRVSRRWLGVVVGLGMSGAIGLPSITLTQTAPSNIVEDATLGTESSQVIKNFNGQPTEVIINGARRGQNLFHSFREFNISAGRNALFFNPSAEIRNILARVTGNNPSDIAGGLGAFEVVGNNFAPTTANLFLINPNGIIFGAGAQLFVGGSFVATTANAIQFGDRGSFSATNPTVPSAVLTINPSAFLFEAIAAQPILNQSRAANPTVPSFIDGLRVSDGQSLLLLGGNVIFDGGIAQARGGRIEIGGLTGSGRVGLTISGSKLDLSFPNNTTLANIGLTNGALLETSGTANSAIQVGGEIQIHGTNLVFANGSTTRSDTFGSQNGGTISLRASQIELRDQSTVQTFTYGAGKSGDIEIEADVLRMQNSSQIGTVTIGGTGSGGQIVIRANQSIDLVNRAQFGSLTIGRGDQVGLGNAGNIFVWTRNLNMQNASGAFSSTYIGDGNAGNIDIQATSINLLNSNLFTSSVGIGAGGSISVKTETLSVKQGSSIQTSTFDPSTFDFNSLSGTSSPEIIAQFIALRDTVPIGRLGQANSGNLSVEATNFVEVAGTSTNGVNRSQLSTGTFGSGSGGKLSIITDQLRIREGGVISTSTSSQGRGGNLDITAHESTNLIGTATLADGSTVSSGLLAASLGTGTSATGAAGTLRLETGRLTLQEGGQILASTSSAGRAGDITITADSIESIGISANRLRSSAIVSQSDAGATGNAGNVTVTTRVFSIRDGAAISTSTFSQGRGGNLDVIARESANIVGVATLADGSTFSSKLSTATSSAGAAGTLRLETGQLTLREGGQISATTTAAGRAGDVAITADSIELVGVSADRTLASAIASSSELTVGAGDTTGDAGNLTVSTRILNIRDGAFISAATFGQGRGGNLKVTARESADFTGTGTLVDGRIFSSGLFTGASGNGAAGTLQLFTKSLNIQDGAGISAVASGFGGGGNINIIVDRSLRMKTGFISSASSFSEGGDINITARDIRLQGDSNILTNVFSGAGGGGDINLTAQSVIALDDSDILAFARDGRGGNVTFNTRAFFGQNYRSAPPGTDPATLDGNNRVDINTSGIITLPDASFLQNSLTDFPQTFTDTTQLLANSCIVRSAKQNGRFVITGSGGLPLRPGDAPLSPFPTGEVRNVAADTVTDETDKLSPPSVSSAANPLPRPWKIGDPIVEPQGVYKLANGELVMSRECSSQPVSQP